MSQIILGIESSCDDTAAAVLQDGWLLSQTTASQIVHSTYGGVVPELASRAHEQNIVPVVDAALNKAAVSKQQLTAIAFTRGPGLMGSLLVGTSFAKGLSIALSIPLVDVNHLQAHVLAHFLNQQGRTIRHPDFPFLCLLVSGGNSQILQVESPTTMHIIGQTIDDAAGEALDKCSKFMGLGYPGGPIIDRLAKQGNPNAFTFAKPHIPGLDYSFSGLKTSLLYFLRDQLKLNPNFIEERKADIAASFQRAIIETLMDKVDKAVAQTAIRRVALSGGVSANTALRQELLKRETTKGWQVFIPPFDYTTDNGAMVAMAGYLRLKEGIRCSLSQPAYARQDN